MLALENRVVQDLITGLIQKILNRPLMKLVRRNYLDG
jgi:hypothetical protein